jgi:two-component system, OmpR family, sensor histidine kinase MprB
MSLRARLGLTAAIAVAVAVIAVAIAAYAGTRSQLRGQVDNSLQGLAHSVTVRATAPPGAPGVLSGGGAVGDRGGRSQGGAPAPRGDRGSRAPRGPGGPPNILGDADEGLGLDQLPPQAFGGAPGTFTLIYPNGLTYVPSGQRYRIPASATSKRIAATGRGQMLSDMNVQGHHIRVLTLGLGPRGALEVALPLTDVDKALSSQLLLLVVIALAGIALAALLGLLVARTALAPIARFTARTEEIATDSEVGEQRLEVRGRDELARLAQTFNATLDSLERSIQAQRNLVADASHELRTPIATIRANLQLMREEGRLSEADRAALREDMIEELDELTALVGDVVELARGAKPEGNRSEVRLDLLVQDAVERSRRRTSGVVIETELEPTLIEGEPDRIARAIANLLDNASKWSPQGGVVEVRLNGGVLSVRDHGPGFHEDDLPLVFNRFHRAKEARSKLGSGLGLAIVRQAAEAHGGFVEASNAPGGGAIVRVGFGSPIETGEAEDSERGSPTPTLSLDSSDETLTFGGDRPGGR